MKNISPNSLPSLKTNYNHDKGRTSRAYVRTYYLCLNFIYFLLFIETPIESTRNDNFFCNIFLWSFVALQFRLTLVWYWLYLRQIWMLSLLALSPFQQLFSFFTFEHSYIGICSCSCFFSDNKQRAEEKDRKQNYWKRKQICVCVCVLVCSYWYHFCMDQRYTSQMSKKCLKTLWDKLSMRNVFSELLYHFNTFKGKSWFICYCIC